MFSPRSYWRSLGEAALFVTLYVALDWASYLYPVGAVNITPSTAQPPLSIALRMVRGLENAPAVLATIVLADIVVRNAPGGYGVTLASAAVLTVGYAALAAVLKRAVVGLELSSIRRLTLFAGTVVAGAGIIGS